MKTGRLPGSESKQLCSLKFLHGVGLKRNLGFTGSLAPLHQSLMRVFPRVSSLMSWFPPGYYLGSVGNSELF